MGNSSTADENPFTEFKSAEFKTAEIHMAKNIDNGDKESAVVTTEETKKMMDEIFTLSNDDQLGICAPFYLSQSRHILANNDSVINIGYNIGIQLENTWKSAIERAIKIVNNATPGINIINDKKLRINKQIVIISTDKNVAQTLNNIKKWNHSTIILGTKWNVEQRNGTALHELLHALGVHHEHKRNDRNKFGISLNEKCCKKRHKNSWEQWIPQYEKANDAKIHGITPYDAHSIMHYVICDGQFDIDNDILSKYFSNSPLTGHKRRDILSPLDEIGLNLLYKPCKRELLYNPIKNIETTHLYYCGRSNVTNGHNYPAIDITDGKCGPNDGPNCAACRVLKNDDIPKYNDKNDIVWQGSSGLFYCGKKIDKKNKHHDGYCGPNNGTPCSSCYKLIT
eukprot:150708_1